MPLTLPKFLFGSYKQYKSDTNQFLEWLDRTAKECSPPVEQPKPNTKGKTPAAKRKAKRIVEANTPSHMKPLPTGGKVPLSHFVALARVVADSGRNIRVPRLVAVMISRAIALRKQCSAWFHKHAKGESRVNRAHTHFVVVLEEVLHILKAHPSDPAGASQEQKEASNGKPVDEVEALENRFAVLDLEEAEESEKEEKEGGEASASPPNPPAEASQKPDVDVYDDAEDDEEGKREEAIFAVYCLFEDMRKLRDFIKQIWQDYKQEKVDLISAALTTNTAIDLARQSSEEFIEKNREPIARLRKELPSPDTNLAAVYYNAVGRRMGINPFPDQSLPMKNPPPWDMRLADLADYCYVPTFSLLTVYCQQVRNPGSVSTYNKGWAYDYNPDVNRSRLSPGQRWAEDMEIVLRSLANFSFLGKGNQPVPGQDELTRGLRKMEQTGNAPFWLTFATQSQYLPDFEMQIY